MNQALNKVKRGGTILFFGVPPMHSDIKLNAFDVYFKGVTILGSFTSLRNSY